MKRLKIFLFNTFIVIIGSLILQIIKFIFNIYVSNKISPEVLGIFQLIMSTYYFGITLACSGISISCIRIVSEELALGNSKTIKFASNQCIKISICASLIVSFIFFVNADNIANLWLQNKVNSNIIYLICTALPLISVSSAITGYFIAVRRAYKTVFGTFLEYTSKIISTIILLKYFCKDSSINSICFALILGDVISELVCFCYLNLIYFFDLKEKFHYSTITSNSFLKRIFKILLPVAITSYIKSGISTIKQLLIPSSLQKNIRNPEIALGQYGIISGMAFPVVMFPATFLVAFANLLIPEFSRYYIKKDYKKIKIYTHKLLLISFLFSLFFSVIFYIFADNIGFIIYHRANIGLYIKIFSLLIPFIYVDIIIDNILKGLDAQSSVMFINIIDLVISTIIIFFFVPIFGIKGYIISIFISEILNLSLSLRKLFKLI